MSTTPLSDTTVELSVSDPFEFATECGDRPHPGTIADSSPDAILVQLDPPLRYRGKQLIAAVARPRHVGDSTQRLVVDRKLFVNILFLEREVAGLNALSPTEPGVAAIGTAFVGQVADSA